MKQEKINKIFDEMINNIKYLKRNTYLIDKEKKSDIITKRK